MSDEEESHEMLEEYKFNLRKPIKYAHKGEQREAEFVTLLPPTSKHSDECAALKQAFFIAIRSQAGADDDDSGDEPEKINGTQAMVLLSMTPTKELDLRSVMAVGRSLFTSKAEPIALVDGEARMTVPLFEQLRQEDFEEMLGEYMVNFITASSMAQMRKKSSKE